MFGLFYLITNTLFSGAAKVKQKIDYAEARERARNNNEETYYGDNGERLVSTDREVYRKYVNGDKVLADLYTGQIYRNFSKEKRHAKEKEAEKNGKTVIDITYNEIQEYNKSTRSKAKSNLIKPQYRDIKTRDYYIMVFINGIRFYMNLIDGNIVRMADGETGEDKWGNLNIEDIINIINNRQKKLFIEPKKNHSYMWWEEHFYLRHSSGNILVIDNNGIIFEGNRIRDEKIKNLISELKRRKE